MGHWHPTKRPSTTKWDAVTHAVASGAGAPAVVSAASAAVGEQLLRAGLDRAVLEAASLLFQLPGAAASEDFAGSLRDLGLDVSAAPGISEITCAFSDAVDRVVDRQHSRTDLSELAHMAALEALAATLRDPSAGRARTSPDYARQRLAACVTGGEFTSLAEGFLGSLTARWVAYQLSRELSGHVGKESRFADANDKRAFELEAGTRSREAAREVRDVADQWLARIGSSRSATVDDVAGLIRGGVAAIEAELRRAAAS